MAATAGTRTRLRGKESGKRHVEEREREEIKLPVCQPWMPSTYTAFKALLSARLCAAIWSNISDCDEVFNYWEPMHYLLEGSGFQTWEYSPVYAIRSYAYLWLHALPMQLYTAALQANKIMQFYFLRCLLGFTCALCETYFYRAICRHFGANTGRLTLCFLLFSSGLFISSAAFLPSSFAMYMTMTAMAAWYSEQYPAAVFSIAASAIMGWPFAGGIGFPIAWDLLFRQRKLLFFIKWALVSAVVCLVPLVLIDSYYFGHVVVAPLNIVLYNVFSEHGPNIYGVEPWSFYFLNGFLNFNIVFPMALGVLPFAIVVRRLLKQPSQGLPLWLSLGSMYIWIAIFFTRPHKEERFLFPIYPLFCLAAAITLDHIQKLYSYLFVQPATSSHYSERSGWLAAVCCSLFALISLSRSMALYYGYHAPLDVYSELTVMANEPVIHGLPTDKDINVCVGKEWYRYPSSFFLPNDRWHLKFLKSQFAGQLPKPFSEGKHATRAIPTDMNDMNREEPSRYFDISKCHYLIDVDVEKEVEYEPRYSAQKDKWTIVASSSFLDSSKSDRLFRAFYIPFISAKHCTYRDYNLLKSKHTKSGRS